MDFDRSLHVDLDGAWPDNARGLRRVDARAWGPRLRFSAPSRLVEQFYRELAPQLAPFILYGSGDFHYLTALWIRRVAQPFNLVSFDNHPDWAVTPPRWAAGAWVNRALELPHVQTVNVWGCGNFECWWPGQIFGNRRAERAGKLSVHPWADARPAQDRHRRGAILRETWRERFSEFVQQHRGEDFYVTIDLDCLRADEAVTNWEAGDFAIVDLVWALERLREAGRVIAGDLCGAYSQPRYSRWKQKFASEFDHPKLPLRDIEEIRRINVQALAQLWPALTA
jgi:arginase family enzyme